MREAHFRCSVNANPLICWCFRHERYSEHPPPSAWVYNAGTDILGYVKRQLDIFCVEKNECLKDPNLSAAREHKSSAVKQDSPERGCVPGPTEHLHQLWDVEVYC